MQLPLVSIIVPIHNSEKTLNRCIDSILNQDYQELEVFLVDDGSGDGSLAICRDYAKRDARVKVIRKQGDSQSCVGRDGGRKISESGSLHCLWNL